MAYSQDLWADESYFRKEGKALLDKRQIYLLTNEPFAPKQLVQIGNLK